jgi:hypothetical protein
VNEVLLRIIIKKDKKHNPCRFTWTGLTSIKSEKRDYLPVSHATGCSGVFKFKRPSWGLIGESIAQTGLRDHLAVFLVQQ